MRQTACARRCSDCYDRRRHLGGRPHARHEATGVRQPVRRGGAWPLAARAQQPDRMRRISVLQGLAADDPEAQIYVAALQQGLQEAGWTVGRNLRIDYRWSAGDNAGLRRNAAELVALNPDVIVAGYGPTSPILHQLTSTVPIVFAMASIPSATACRKSGAAGRQSNRLHPVRIWPECQMA